MQFNRDIFRAGNRQNAERLADKVQRCISGVADDQQFVLFREFHRFREELDRGGSACRIVRIVQVQQFCTLTLIFREAFQIGQITVFLKQRQFDHFAAEVFGPGSEYGIARNGNNGDVAGIDETRGQQCQSGFTADRMADFGFGIKFHAVKRFHVTRGGLFEFQHAVIGIDAVFPFCALFLQSLDNSGKCHIIRFAHTHVDELHAGIFRHRFAFCAFDLFKFIDFRIFSECFAADAPGECALKKTFCHSNSPFHFKQVQKTNPVKYSGIAVFSRTIPRKSEKESPEQKENRCNVLFQKYL